VGFHILKSYRSQGEILKIELSKSYDCVKWSFIRLLITHFGFEVPFIKWMMAFISSVSFAVLINGATWSFFSSERGLRKGCPLSPLIFLLVAEGLNRAIGLDVRDGEFHGIWFTWGLWITHLLFVDDVIIFCSGQPRYANKLAQILIVFHSTIGMIINPKKCTLTFTNLEAEGIEAYQTLFPFPTQYFSEGIKYLGF